MTRFARLMFSGLLLALVMLTSAQPTLPVTFDLARIQQATVLVMQTRTTSTGMVITCISSGTVVSRDGLVLSNAHGTVPSTDCPGDRLMIAFSPRPGEPPVPEYQADVVQANPGIDLALLRITRDSGGRVLEPSELAFSFVELIEDSSTVRLDDRITAVGYPGIGDEPVLAIDGTIQGFGVEPSAGTEPAWFKTNADIPGTMSGGGAYDRAGRLVAVPTTAPLTSPTAGGTAACIQDTNDDGLINVNDSCVPVGGAINALRPANFARPLLRSASLALTVSKLSENQRQSSVTALPSVTNLFFAQSITSDGGQPVSVVDRLPTGSDSLYLFFDYANMTPETVYELRVTREGLIDPIFSISPVRWSGGESGLWYIGSTGQAFPGGSYEFTLFINGQIAADPIPLRVGDVPTDDPSFNTITFGISDGTSISGNGYVLGAGEIATAQFIYNNMVNGTPWTAIWYSDEGEESRTEGVWESAAPNGSFDTSISAPGGLVPGNYRLQLYIDGVLEAQSDFIIAGAREGAEARIFTRERFVVADTPSAALAASPVTTFTNRVDNLYALFDWERIRPGTLWRMRWLVDGQVFFDQLVPWNAAETGTDYVTQLTSPGGVPDGTYRLELSIGNIPLASAEIQIGIGQLIVDPSSRAAGVQFTGQVIDADTRQGIANVSVIVISEEFSVADYTASMEQVYAMATTDRNGYFQVDRPLNYDLPYSLYIAADGYLPITADGIEVTRETLSPMHKTIYLTSD